MPSPILSDPCVPVPVPRPPPPDPRSLSPAPSDNYPKKAHLEIQQPIYKNPDPPGAHTRRLKIFCRPKIGKTQGSEWAGFPLFNSPARPHKRLSRYAGIYPVPNLAVDVCETRCLQMPQRKLLKEGKIREACQADGQDRSHCAAMPKLSGPSTSATSSPASPTPWRSVALPGTEGTQPALRRPGSP